MEEAALLGKEAAWLVRVLPDLEKLSTISN